MLTHLVRRVAVESARTMSIQDQAELWENSEYSFPSWSWIVFAITFLLWFFVAATIEYFVGLVIVNLAIIESPTSATVAIYNPITSEEPDATLEKKDEIEVCDVEVEMATVSGRPITHSITKTMAHIQAIGGRSAKWRGLQLFLTYSMLTSVIECFVSTLPIPASPFFATLAATVVGARIHCAWTHATIAMPSSKALRDRLPPRHNMRFLVGPHLMRTFVTEAVLGLNLGVGCYAVNQIIDLLRTESQRAGLYIAWGALPIATVCLSYAFLLLPVQVMLIRREASLLPEEEETIVPMDRTFGGRVTRIGQVLTLRDAIASVSGEAWVRLMMLAVKCILFGFGLLCLGLEMFILDIVILLGTDGFAVLLISIQAQLGLVGF